MAQAVLGELVADCAWRAARFSTERAGKEVLIEHRHRTHRWSDWWTERSEERAARRLDREPRKVLLQTCGYEVQIEVSLNRVSSWVHLGDILAVLEAILGVLEAYWAVLGPSWGPLGGLFETRFKPISKDLI